MTIYIDHERYGVRAAFATIEEAQDAARSCGPDWADTIFRLAANLVVDDHGEIVGEEIPCPGCCCDPCECLPDDTNCDPN